MSGYTPTEGELAQRAAVEAVDPELLVAEARTYVEQPNALARTPDGRAAIYMARRLIALDGHRAAQLERAIGAGEGIAARLAEAQAGLDKVQALVVPVLSAARAVEERADSDNLARLSKALRELRDASRPAAAPPAVKP